MTYTSNLTLNARTRVKCELSAALSTFYQSSHPHDPHFTPSPTVQLQMADGE